MTNTPTAQLSFRETLDEALLYIDFPEDSTEYSVYVELQQAVRYAVNNTAPYGTLFVQRSAFQVLQRLIEAWRNILTTAKTPDAAKPSARKLQEAAQTAAGTKALTPKTVEEEVLVAFVVPLQGGKSRIEAHEIAVGIVEAASKVYLELHEKIEVAVKELEEQGTLQKYEGLGTPSKASKKKGHSDGKSTLFKSVSVLLPGQEGYDPLIPKFTRMTPGVVREGTAEEMDAVMPKDDQEWKKKDTVVEVNGKWYPWRPANGATGLTSTNAGSEQGDESFGGEDAGDGEPGDAEEDQQPAAAPASASASAPAPAPPPPVKIGNNKHNSVPWEADEEASYCATIAGNRTLSWAKITDLVNAQYRGTTVNHPMRLGQPMQRGLRTRDAVRSHPMFKWVKDEVAKQSASDPARNGDEWRRAFLDVKAAETAEKKRKRSEEESEQANKRPKASSEESDDHDPLANLELMGEKVLAGELGIDDDAVEDGDGEGDAGAVGLQGGGMDLA